VQVTFAILIVAQTFLSPFQGFLVDKFGPRLLLSAGAIITSLSWILASWVTGIWGLYLTYGFLGGVGTGIIYVGVVGLMVQWFPDKRGFAVGMVAAGYGFGAILTTFAISGSIKSSGVSNTLLMFGSIIGLIGFLAAQGMRRPTVAELAAHKFKYNASKPDQESNHGYKSSEMLRKPVFWLMFIMMTMMSTSGLMVISQMGAFAKHFWGRGHDDFWHGGVTAGIDDRSFYQWFDPTVFRLGVRSLRPRKYDVHRFRDGRRRHVGVADDKFPSGAVRAVVRRRFFRMG
jgi:MFS family permease